METAPAPLLALIAKWPEPASAALWTCRTLFQHIAQESSLGPLDEALKWGQPSWQPTKPRTGSTLRLNWQADQPDHMALFVDCKTDLAARMNTLYPDLPANDLRRRMTFRLDALPEQALSHLAQMTFSYHLSKRQSPKP